MALPTTNVKPTIFGEYIGSKPYPLNFDDFPDIINPQITEFHFMIAFASEVYHGSGTGGEGRVGTGEFYRNWLVPFIDGEMIQKLKKKCDNVKVLISIGGRGSKYPFNPAEKEMWIRNARASLIMMINDLKDPSGNNLIDGIDINYDTITCGDEGVFVNCIGELINSLKYRDQLINVVSIAPSYPAITYYGELYRHYEKAIDWVNYKLYTLPKPIPTPHAFHELHQQAGQVYTVNKLLVGFSTDPDDAGKLPREVFIQFCKEFPRIFIWNANDSANNIAPFLLEGLGQNLMITQNQN